MKADYFTKPLQGKIFRKFRDWLMKIQYDDPLKTNYPEDHTSVLKEIYNSKEYYINLTNLSRNMYNKK